MCGKQARGRCRTCPNLPQIKFDALTRHPQPMPITPTLLVSLSGRLLRLTASWRRRGRISPKVAKWEKVRVHPDLVQPNDGRPEVVNKGYFFGFSDK